MDMDSIQIVALYAGLNLLLLPILMVRVGQQRIATKTSLGDGDQPALLQRIRAHANFTETTPFALLGLLAMAGFSGTPTWLLHALGGGFTFGRVLHAHGMAQRGAGGKGRTIGALLSLLTFVVMGAYLLYKAFTG
ncbi:MAG: hypothetical protein HKN36_03330 [Hellea sp.]|nr:hypothetical protein [Hellea sp.]